MRGEKKGEWGLIKLTPSQPGSCVLGDSVTPGHSEAWPTGGVPLWASGHRTADSLLSCHLSKASFSSWEPRGTPACPVPLLASRASESLVLCCLSAARPLRSPCLCQPGRVSSSQPAASGICVLGLRAGSVPTASPPSGPPCLLVSTSLHLSINLLRSISFSVWLLSGCLAVWLSVWDGASIGESALGLLSLA